MARDFLVSYFYSGSAGGFEITNVTYAINGLMDAEMVNSLRTNMKENRGYHQEPAIISIVELEQAPEADDEEE